MGQLGLLGGRSAIRPLVRAMSEPNRWSVIRIADILRDMGREVADELMAGWDEMAPRGRLAAVDVLAAVGDVAVGPWLAERLRDDDSEVRARAAHALRRRAKIHDTRVTARHWTAPLPRRIRACERPS